MIGEVLAQGSPPSVAAAIPVSPPIESFDAAAAVSGSAIAGLALGQFGKLLSVEQLQLASPGKGGAFCIDAITQDGRYTLRGVYKSPTTPEADWVAIRPLTSRFRSQLQGIDPVRFALRAYTAHDGKCNPKDAVHLPQYNGEEPILTILANGGSRSGVAEVFDEAGGRTAVPLSRSHCRPSSGGARIAFDLRCELALPNRPTGATVRVSLTFDDGFGAEVSSVRVFLPAIKSPR
jgi:hypothetical protein